MILKKLVLLLLIALNEEFSFGSQQTNLQEKPVLNFVMATDKNYIIPTLVAMYSVIKNCKDCIKHFIVFVGPNKIKQEDQDILTETPAPDEQDERKLRSLTASDVRISIIKIPYSKKINDSITANTDGLICLRVFLPNLLQKVDFSDGDSQHGGVVKPSEYLWLDSDVLVVKDLKEMYATCKKQNQPIIGSNYLYIDCSLANPSEGNIFYSPDTQPHHPISMTNWKEKKGNSGKAPSRCVIHDKFQISGGVVFFNLQTKDTQITQGRPLPGIPLKLRVEDKFSKLSEIFQRISPADRTEEFAMTQYLFSLGQLHYILPTTYNCRLCYPEVASVLLKSPLIQGLDPKDSDMLANISGFNVSIWHPDRETKFWKIDPAQLPRSRSVPMLAPIQSKNDVVKTWYQYAKEIEEIIGQQELATFCAKDKGRESET